MKKLFITLLLFCFYVAQGAHGAMIIQQFTAASGGGESLLVSTDDGTGYASFTAQSSGTLYARAAYNNVDTPNAEAINLLSITTSDGTRCAYVGVRDTGGEYYRVYAGTASTSENASFTAQTLDDQIYYIELAYTFETGVTGYLRESDLTEVASDTATDATARTCSRVYVDAEGSYDSVWDMVEVRTDTSWGNATNQLFYSDFNDETDDAQWTLPSANWDDDYTTNALE